MDIAGLLTRARTIAVIGASTDPYRTSHHIAKYLQQQGYRMIPVNPAYDTVLGEQCYDSVNEIPKQTRIDIVDIFRNSRFTAAMVESVLERVERTGDKPVVWTQLGVSSEEAKQKAEQAGLTYVEERCIMVDHRTHILEAG